MFKLLIVCLCYVSLAARGEEIEINVDEGAFIDEGPFIDEDIPVVEGDGGDVRITLEEDVLVLNKDNFDVMVLSKPIILVEFYTEWCGHCKQLAPHYAKAATMLKENNPPIPLAKVDAAVETELAKKYDVNGFPTLFIFRNGQREEYNGPRTALGIAEYMKERADPDWKPPKETVIALTTADFDEVVNNEDLILVEFYAPWCGHCKQLAPEYERAAKQLAKINNPIKLAKVEATLEKDLALRFDVTGYPTLFVFRRGKKFAYKGAREEQGIVGYMKQMQLPPSIQVNSVSELKRLLREDYPTIVGLFEKGTNDKSFETLTHVANEQRDETYSFLHTFNSKLIKELKEKSGTVLLIQPERYQSQYEPTRHRFSLEEDVLPSDITYFMGNNSLPLVGLRGPQTASLYGAKYPIVVVYYDVDFSFDGRTQTQLVRKQVLKAANKYKGKITFAIANEKDYEDELKDLGLADSGEDVNVGFFKSLLERFALEPTEDLDADHIEEFVEKVLSGDVEAVIKSQLAPDVNNGPVKVIVGSTFEELVTMSNKNVLIEFYAPWCGHCNKLEPIYKKLAQKYSDNADLVVAKLDGTVNDYPGQFVVAGYPSIYFIPVNNKFSPHKYSGDRSLEDLSTFLDKMLEHEFSQISRKDEL